MCAHSASVDWLCCAASMCAEPPGPRNTTGSVNCPPDICRIFAALLMSWSAATSEKFQVMSSMTGRRPTMAAPMPTPTKPFSAMGVSMTRLSPNLSMRPFDTL